MKTGPRSQPLTPSPSPQGDLHHFRVSSSLVLMWKGRQRSWHGGQSQVQGQHALRGGGCRGREALRSHAGSEGRWGEGRLWLPARGQRGQRGQSRRAHPWACSPRHITEPRIRAHCTLLPRSWTGDKRQPRDQLSSPRGSGRLWGQGAQEACTAAAPQALPRAKRCHSRATCTQRVPSQHHS